MNDPTDSGEVESGDTLRLEARQFARYIANGSARPELVERYVDACRKLTLDRPAGEDRGLLAFVRSHPSSLPAIDAACGIVRPDALLRRRLFLMLALLETTPEHSALFIAKPMRWLPAAGHLTLAGLAACVKIVMGLVLYPLARHAR